MQVHTPETKAYTMGKHFHTITFNNARHTLIFSILCAHFLIIKKVMTAAIHNTDFNTIQREATNTLKKPYAVGCSNSIFEQ